MSDGVLQEAYGRLGHDAAVNRWIDRYQARLEEARSPHDRIHVNGWQAALGDPRRLGDWPVFFAERIDEAGRGAGPGHRPGELMDVAVRHGDEHLVKLTDTALDVWGWTGDPLALAAVRRGAELIESSD